jgi:hypothetical protein
VVGGSFSCLSFWCFLGWPMVSVFAKRGGFFIFDRKREEYLKRLGKE